MYESKLATALTAAEGKKRIKLSGKWNSHCEMVKCDFEGQPLPDMEPQVGVCVGDLCVCDDVRRSVNLRLCVWPHVGVRALA
jgi:hypothetical protein